MLFGLDKSRHDFFNASYARRVLDLVEGVLNDPRVSHILVQKSLFLFVGLNDFRESEFQDLDGVGELLLLPARVARLHHLARVLVEALVVELDRLVPLLEPLLQLLNFQFEFFLFLFVLRF